MTQPTPRIADKAMHLIPYQPSFLDSFIEWRAQPLAIRHNPLGAMTKEDIAKMLESEGSDLSELTKYETYRWFVECDGATVGSVGLKNISHTMGYAEIGYGIGEAHQGRGIATLAVGLLVQMCFRESPLRKLLAYVHDKNLASCKVLQKLGFRQEGLLREHYLINGVPENELLFGLLKREWKHGSLYSR
jgi:[ribosomal protein S5]-alanine N-acetyltransferase